jgi:carbamoyltransferase
MKNDEIVGCVSEERFTQKKNQDGFPKHAVEYLLNSQKIKPRDLDLVVNGGTTLTLSWDPINYHGINKKVHEAIYLMASQSPFIDKAMRFIYKLFTKNVSKLEVHNLIKKNLDIPLSKLLLADHHQCHAWAAYFGFTPKKYKGEALILTCDAEGDMKCATVWRTKGKKLKLLVSTPAGNSPASIYADITRILGMKINEHEYKVMGLAPYAKGEYAQAPYEIIRSLVWLDKEMLQFKSHFGQRAAYMLLRNKLSQYRFDSIAFAVQKWTEELMVKYIEGAVKKYKIPVVVVGGGWFMNVKGNMEIYKSPLVDKLFVCPSGGDESLAIGACYLGFESLGGKNPKEVESLYLGPEYTNEEVAKSIEAHKDSKVFGVRSLKTPEKEIAKLIAGGHIVARFYGKMEWGARALGNRSILADPRNDDIKKIINEQIKNRDFWMPFAPSLTPAGARKYLVNPKGITGEFMVMAFKTTSKGVVDLNAAIHPYDESVRPQIVTKTINPNYFKIIEEFKKISGVDGILNTSFNLHGFPIVCSPDDAIKTFLNSGLEFLVLNNLLLTKSH